MVGQALPMKLVVRNGTIVTPAGRYRADVVCVDGRIAAIEADAPRTGVDDEVEASGLLVFPGFIDPHVHSRDPGLTHKEDFAHSTRAAAAGGVTTLFEMPNAIPPVSDASVLRERAAHHEASAFVDFGLWAISLGRENLADVPELLAAGAVGVKLFWGYALHRQTKQLVYNLADEPPENLFLPPGNDDVLDLCASVARAGGLLAAHCEDRQVIEAATRAFGRPIASYDDFLDARPDAAEATAVAVATELARATGCRFHVLHMSSARGARLLQSAQADGVPLTGETGPQYLTLTDETYASVGGSMKVYPPIRRAADRDALWEALSAGAIVSLGSDHAPHTVEEKQRDLETQPAGIGGVETLVRVMLNEVHTGRITPQRLADVLSEGTARLYGIHPQKGAILPGADADFTLVDPDATWEIRNEELHSKQPLSVWHGARGRGVPTRAIVRGSTVMVDGEPVGEPQGRLVRPRRGAEADAAPHTALAAVT
jgi:dihydroorotase